MLDESENREKSEIIRAIGQRRIPGSMEKLSQLALDDNINQSREAVAAIKLLAEVEDINTLTDLLIRTNDPVKEKDLVIMLQNLVIQIDPAEQRATEIITKIKEISNENKKGQLMQILGASGNPSALPVLESAIEDSNPLLKKEAIKAASNWPNETPADILLISIKSSESEAIRILAFRGYLGLLRKNKDMSNPELLSRYAEAIKIAPNQSEQKKVFSGLAELEYFPAAEFVVQFLSDKKLKSEAEVALIQILRETIEPGNKEKSLKMIKTLIDNTSSSKIRTEAREMYESLN
jgi:HEAT repeat protein